MQELISNPWFQFSGWIAGILGLIGCLYFGMKAKQKKEISYKVYTVSVVSDAPTAINTPLTIHWGDKQIDNLFISDVFIWNSGNVAIRSGDYKEEDPLSIVPEPYCEIYQVNQHKLNNQSTKVILPEDVSGDRVSITFNVIEKKEGFRVKVFHSSAVKLKVVGKIIDHGSPLYNRTDDRRYFTITYLLPFAVVVLTLFWCSNTWRDLLGILVILVIVGVPVAIIFAVATWLLERAFKPMDVPEDLFDENDYLD